MEKVIVITGGSDGVGKELATNLSKENKIIIIARNTEKLEKVASEINCAYRTCDVTNERLVQSAVNDIIQEYGKIDCLINDAGTWTIGNLEDNDYQKISEVIDINIKGTIYMVKAVVPYMKEKKSGLIININSTAGVNFKEGYSVYTSSKWAITGFTRSIQPELLPFGIRVTNFCPGTIKTNLFIKNGVNRDTTNALTTKQVAKAIEFVVSQDKDVIIPEIVIKNIRN